MLYDDAYANNLSLSEIHICLRLINVNLIKLQM